MSQPSDHTSSAVPSLSRRSLLQGAAVSPFLLTSAVGAASDRPISAKTFNRNYTAKPLPFDASKLRGLSARLLESHWSNNYGGSVRALNGVQAQLGQLLASKDVPNYLYNGLKREHLMRTGSVILHELYFENLGGNGRAGSAMRTAIARDFGSFDTCMNEFRRISLGLGGGSGWVVLAWNHHFGVLENYWMADHMHYPTGSTPLLVIDLYEHSYQMDYGAATASYLDAFLDNVNWDEVQARYERAIS